MRPIILCGFLILAPLTVAIGQDSLPPGTRVRITAPTHFDGRKRGVVQPGAVIEVPVGEQWPLTVRLPDVTRLDRFAGRKSAWSVGARWGGILGFVGGGVGGVAVCNSDFGGWSTSDCETHQAAGAAVLGGAVGLVLGGAVGAGVGAFFKHDSWEEVPLDWLKVGVRPVREGVGLGANTASHALPSGTRVRVTAPAHFEGRKEGIAQSGAVIGVPEGPAGPLTVPLVDVTRLDRFAGRKSVWWVGARRGGFLGLVGGGVAGLVFCALDEPNDWDCENAALGAASWGTVGLVLGGAVGAGVGAFFKHDSWEEVPLDWLKVGVRPALARDAAAQRRGFIIGVGLGSGLTTGDVDTKVGVATDFRIGTMIGRSVQLYFANKMTFTDIRETQDVDSVGAVGVTGIGVTYQMPSGVLINGLVGVLQLHWPEKAGRIGIGAGVGYEFAEHWVVALDGSFGRVDDWSAPAQSSDGKVTFLNVALTLNVLSF